MHLSAGDGMGSNYPGNKWMVTIMVNWPLELCVINWFSPSLSSPLNKVWNLCLLFLTRVCVQTFETTQSPILF